MRPSNLSELPFAAWAFQERYCSYRADFGFLPAFDELHTSTPAESSADLRKQVLAARAVQAKRYATPGYEGVRCNAQLTAGQVRRVCRMTPAAERLLRASYETLGLSARAHDRILRVARTVADLAGKQLLDEEALLEALQYRAQEKVETF